MIDELEDFQGPVTLPGAPTEAPPGSEQKIRIMMERASRREELFHPQDGRNRTTPPVRVTNRTPAPWIPQEEPEQEEILSESFEGAEELVTF